jgi:hypothetical protein
MAKQKQPSLVDILFPLKGLDLDSESSKVAPGLTHDAQNVRGCDPSTMRLRGGSRPGLSRYINEKVNGTAAIQHLNVIVDPTLDAVIQEFDDVTWYDEFIPDDSDNPSGRRRRNPGRRVRRGGSGRRPLRSRARRNNGSKNITFLQKIVSTDTLEKGPKSVTFTTDPRPLSLIVVVAAFSIFAPDDNDTITSTITDTRGNSYQRIGGFAPMPVGNPPAYWNNMEVFYAINTNILASTTTITATRSQPESMGDVVALEYINVNTIDPVASTIHNVEPLSVSDFTTGAGLAHVEAIGQMFFVVFDGGNYNNTTLHSSFSLRSVGDRNTLRIGDKKASTLNGMSGSATSSTNSSYASRGVVFRKGS